MLSGLVLYWLLLPDSHMFTMDAFFTHVSITWNLVLQRSWCYCDACNSITPVRVTPATWGDGDRHYGGQVTTFSQVRITNWKKKKTVCDFYVSKRLEINCMNAFVHSYFCQLMELSILLSNFCWGRLFHAILECGNWAIISENFTKPKSVYNREWSESLEADFFLQFLIFSIRFPSIVPNISFCANQQCNLKVYLFLCEPMY